MDDYLLKKLESKTELGFIRYSVKRLIVGINKKMDTMSWWILGKLNGFEKIRQEVNERQENPYKKGRSEGIWDFSKFLLKRLVVGIDKKIEAMGLWIFCKEKVYIKEQKVNENQEDADKERRTELAWGREGGNRQKQKVNKGQGS